MNYKIDQSGKIDQTERHTVIACTNSKSMTVFMKKSEKRKLQKIFTIVGNAAYQGAKKRRKPDIIVGASEVMNVILGTKKAGIV